MHVATLMFDSIVEKNEDYLTTELNYDQAGLRRDRRLVRMAALLHDIGHSPFSHAGEMVMPRRDAKSRFKHEEYSDAAVRKMLKDVIEGHKINQNYDLKADDVADLISGNPKLGRRLMWKQLISGQLDADRADYLLRDSYHIGVQYGRYDLARLINCMSLAVNQNSFPVVAIENGGLHVAESLVLARYLMFTQVYFQHTRRAFDYHYGECLAHLLQTHSKQQDNALLESREFPPPSEIEKYLDWDDWKVLGMLKSGMGGEHGTRLCGRNHYRSVYETESPTIDSLTAFRNVQDEIKSKYGSDSMYVDMAQTSYYKLDDLDINIRPDNHKLTCQKLSSRVSTVSALKKADIRRIYLKPEVVKEAKKEIKELKS